MKFLRFVAFLFYRYYRKVRSNIPHFQAILAMSFLAFLHLLQLTVLARILGLFSFPRNSFEFLVPFGCMIPIAILLSLGIRERHLKEMMDEEAYNWNKIFDKSVWLIIYIIFTIGSLMLLIYFSARK